MKAAAIFIIVISFCSLSMPVYGDVTYGLVSHWALDEGQGNTAYDSAGSNNGAIKGSASWVAGKVGDHALYFNDQKIDYVQGASSPFDFSNTTFTVSGWFKTSSAVYIASEGGYLHGGWFLDCQEDKILVLLKEGSPNAYNAYHAFSNTGQPYNDGNWHHAAAVITTSTTSKTGNRAKIYVDGLPVPIYDVQAYPYSPSSDRWCVGSIGGNGSPYSGLQGAVDDVRIYNRALSSEEIYELYTIPEPSTLLLLGLGALFLRRKK